MGYNFTISILISVLIINVYLAVELSTGIVSRTVHSKRVYSTSRYFDCAIDSHFNFDSLH
jgi:hypothetical protein